MRCPKCGRVIPDTARFCAYCGSTVEARPAPPSPARGRRIARLVALAAAVLLAAATAAFLVAQVRGLLQQVQSWKPLAGQPAGPELEHTLDNPHPYTIVFSPNGQFLAVGGEGHVRMWHAGNAQLVSHVGTGRPGYVTLAPDWKLAAAHGIGAGALDAVAVYRISEDGLSPVGRLNDFGVTGLDFSSDGSMMASGSYISGNVSLWDVSASALERMAAADTREEAEAASDAALLTTLTGHQGGVMQVAFSPNGSILASTSTDATVRVWRVSDGTLLHTLEGHEDRVGSVAFNPDGTLLASGSKDRTVKLWRVSNGRLLRTLKGHQDFVGGVAFSPDGSWLASASDDATVRVWRVTDGELVDTLEHNNVVYSVAFSPDGDLLASGSRGGTVRLWRLDQA